MFFKKKPVPQAHNLPLLTLKYALAVPIPVQGGKQLQIALLSCNAAGNPVGKPDLGIERILFDEFVKTAGQYNQDLLVLNATGNLLQVDLNKEGELQRRMVGASHKSDCAKLLQQYRAAVASKDIDQMAQYWKNLEHMIEVTYAECAKSEKADKS